MTRTVEEQFKSLKKLIKKRPDLERKDIAKREGLTSSQVGVVLHRSGTSFGKLRKRSIQRIMLKVKKQ